MKTQEIYIQVKEIILGYKNGIVSRALALQMLLDVLHEIDGAARNKVISKNDKNRYFILVLQHISLLQRSPGANSLRNKFTRANLLFNSRSTLLVTGIDFSGLTLPELSLSGIVLIACNFDEADMRGAKLNSSQFQGCSFRRADLSEADFRRSTLYGCGFEDANLKNAKGVSGLS
jgi:uncharacterized protein YjbI with pentapeptide repeats